MTALTSEIDFAGAGDTIRIEDYDPVTDNHAQQNLPFPGLDFARLVPFNHAAKLAFDLIARLKLHDEGWCPHARQFIHVSSLEELDDESVSESSTASTPILTGYYRLNLAVLPTTWRFGWLFGHDPSNVDLLLTINGKADRVRGRHGRIVHHHDTSVLMLHALPTKKVLLNGSTIDNQGRMLPAVPMSIVIGNLAYKLEYVSLNHTNYRDKLFEVMQERDQIVKYDPEYFDPTPSDRHFELQGYQFHTPQAAGAYGVVSACVNCLTGQIHAVKRVQRRPATRSIVEDEVTILKDLQDLPHVACLIEVLYSDGDEISMGNRGINDVYMIFQPWAPDTLYALMNGSTSDDDKMTAYHQGAQALRYVHEKRVIHRDVKPANFLLASKNPPYLILTDLGHATRLTNSKDHLKGTVAYHPPEITALKRNTNTDGCWTTASDVFSYGVVGVELFHDECPKAGTRQIDNIVHLRLLAMVKTKSPVDKLLSELLSWTAANRPSMREVLLNPIWTSPETPHTSSERKRDRPAEID